MLLSYKVSETDQSEAFQRLFNLKKMFLSSRSFCGTNRLTCPECTPGQKLELELKPGFHPQHQYNTFMLVGEKIVRTKRLKMIFSITQHYV